MVKVYRLFKRVIDICLSSILLVVSSPLLLILALSIFVSAGTPVIFKSDRVGKDKKIFVAYKFRTLVNGVKKRKDGLSDLILINKLARYMRDTHLDELLQLVNILKGDISFIGPRPLPVPRYYYLKSKDPSWDKIFKIKPGMTCINQIARYSNSGLDKARTLKGLKNIEKRNRLAFDKYYIKNESFFLDLKMLFWTIEYLFFGFFTKIFRKAEK